MDSKTQEAAESILDGSLANTINQNTRYALSGIAIGAIVGFMVASVMGKNKIIFAGTGAILGGGVGFIGSKIKK